MAKLLDNAYISCTLIFLQPNELNIPVRENTDIYAGFGKKHPLELLSNQNSTLVRLNNYGTILPYLLHCNTTLLGEVLKY